MKASLSKNLLAGLMVHFLNSTGYTVSNDELFCWILNHLIKMFVEYLDVGFEVLTAMNMKMAVLHFDVFQNIKQQH
jgi:hypothetical protein